MATFTGCAFGLSWQTAVEVNRIKRITRPEKSSVSAPEAGFFCAIGKDLAFQNRLAKLLASNAAGS
jgi:hypothetical protein